MASKFFCNRKNKIGLKICRQSTIKNATFLRSGLLLTQHHHLAFSLLYHVRFLQESAAPRMFGHLVVIFCGNAYVNDSSVATPVIQSRKGRKSKRCLCTFCKFQKSIALGRKSKEKSQSWFAYHHITTSTADGQSGLHAANNGGVDIINADGQVGEVLARFRGGPPAMIWNQLISRRQSRTVVQMPWIWPNASARRPKPDSSTRKLSLAATSSLFRK